MKVHTFNEGDLEIEMGLTVGVPYFEILCVCVWRVAREVFLARCGPTIELDVGKTHVCIRYKTYAAKN